jgi:hypothetical protein
MPLDFVAALLGHQAGSRDTRTLLRHYVRSNLIEQNGEILILWNAQISEVIATSPHIVSKRSLVTAYDRAEQTLEPDDRLEESASRREAEPSPRAGCCGLEADLLI